MAYDSLYVLESRDSSKDTCPGPMYKAIMDAYNNNSELTLTLYAADYDSGETFDNLVVPNLRVEMEGNTPFIDLSSVNDIPEGYTAKPGIRLAHYTVESTPVESTSLLRASHQIEYYKVLLCVYKEETPK